MDCHCDYCPGIETKKRGLLSLAASSPLTLQNAQRLPLDRKSVYSIDEYKRINANPSGKDELRGRFACSLGMHTKVPEKRDPCYIDGTYDKKLNGSVHLGINKLYENLPPKEFLQWRLDGTVTYLYLDSVVPLKNVGRIDFPRLHGAIAEMIVFRESQKVDRPWIVHFHYSPNTDIYTPGQNCLLRQLISELVTPVEEDSRGNPIYHVDHVPADPSTVNMQSQAQLLKELEGCLTTTSTENDTLVVLHGVGDYAEIPENREEVTLVLDLLMALKTDRRVKILFTSSLPDAFWRAYIKRVPGFKVEI